MADMFKSPKGMLNRAKRHLADLEAQFNAFMRDKPWTVVAEKEPDGVTNALKVKFTKRLAEDLPNVVFDCANNLRSVLDQMAFAIGAKHTGLSNPKSAKFPFGPTEADMLNNRKGGCKDLPTEIGDFFAAFKPYKGGNNTLWGLNELCNAPKHKMIYPLAIGGGGLGLGGNFVVGGGGIRLNPSRGWDREINEITFATFPDGAIQGNPNFHIAFTVAFDEVDEVIRGQNPINALRAMTGEVERILVAAQRECRRIGLIQ
jgi:hypothetical protein